MEHNFHPFHEWAEAADALDAALRPWSGRTGVVVQKT